MLQNVLGTFRYLGGKSYDDDFVDKLHYFSTSNLLLALSVLVSWKQFGGRPIECMVPDMFSGAWEQYAENYCWARDTYVVSFQEKVPEKPERYTDERRISYYQWVPFFLLVQAFCFRTPGLIWKHFAHYSGINVHDLVKVAVDTRNIEPDVKRSNIAALTFHLQNALRFHRRADKRQWQKYKIGRFFNLQYSSIYVTMIYMFTKFCYLANVCLQIFLMNRFLATSHYAVYGFGAFMDLVNGTSWEQSRIFPRVTLCDFKVRMVANIQDYTVQCVLVINVFNEKIFIFLWCWYALLFTLTSINLLYWLFMCCVPWSSNRFVNRHLELSDVSLDILEPQLIKRFTSNYLRPDGVFVLRMITRHAGVILGTDLVADMYKSFNDIENKLKQSFGIIVGGQIKTAGGGSMGSKKRYLQPHDSRMTSSASELKQLLNEKFHRSVSEQPKTSIILEEPLGPLHASGSKDQEDEEESVTSGIQHLMPPPKI